MESWAAAHTMSTFMAREQLWPLRFYKFFRRSAPGPCYVDDGFFKGMRCSAYLSYEDAFYRTAATSQWTAKLGPHLHISQPRL